MERISAILHGQNPRVFFLSPNKKELFFCYASFAGLRFLIFIGILHSTSFLFFYALFSLMIITKAKSN